MVTKALNANPSFFCYLVDKVLIKGQGFPLKKMWSLSHPANEMLQCRRRVPATRVAQVFCFPNEVSWRIAKPTNLHVCIYIYYIHIHIYIQIHIHISIYLSIYLSLSLHMHICINIYVEIPGRASWGCGRVSGLGGMRAVAKPSTRQSSNFRLKNLQLQADLPID